MKLSIENFELLTVRRENVVCEVGVQNFCGSIHRFKAKRHVKTTSLLLQHYHKPQQISSHFPTMLLIYRRLNTERRPLNEDQRWIVTLNLSLTRVTPEYPATSNDPVTDLDPITKTRASWSGSVFSCSAP